MSNSQRAKDRRRKRSKLNKTGRSELSKQHFGDKYHVRGRGPLRKTESKAEVLEQRKRSVIPDFLRRDFPDGVKALEEGR